MEIAGDILEHWAIGTVGDTAVGMIATYVSERFDGKTPQEAFQSTMSSADDIILNAVITSAVGTGLDSVTAPKCFVAGTMVTTAAGLVAIENISIGDQVLAQNPETGEIGYKEVLDTFRNETNVVVHVTVNDETFTCTEEHPFYVEGKGWVNANALRAGMVVWLADGTKAIIQDVWVEYLVEAVAVFNFKVEDFHTYFIGYSGVLVHNADCGPQMSNSEGEETPEELFSFGNKTEPRGARPNQDFGVDSYDSLVGPESGPLPQGASNVTNVSNAPLSGHYHSLPAGTTLPEGLGVIADGSDIISNSPHGPGHYTIYPTKEMTVASFNELYKSLPWSYGGKK